MTSSHIPSRYEPKLKAAAETEVKLKAEVERLSKEAADAVEALVESEEKLTAALPSNRVMQEQADAQVAAAKELQEAKFATNTLRAKLTEAEGKHRADSIEVADVRAKLVTATSEIAATKNEVWELTSATKAQADKHAAELAAGQHVLEGARRETVTLTEQVSDNAAAAEVLRKRVTTLEESLGTIETEKVAVTTTLEIVQMELTRTEKALADAATAQRVVQAGDGDSVVIAKYLDHHNRHGDVTVLRLEKGSYRLFLKDGTKHKLTVRVNGESVYIRKGGGWQGLEDWLGRHVNSSSSSSASKASSSSGAGSSSPTVKKKRISKPKVPIPSPSGRKLPPKPPSRTTSPSRRLASAAASPAAKKTSRKSSASDSPSEAGSVPSSPLPATAPSLPSLPTNPTPATDAVSSSKGDGPKGMLAI